MTEEKQEEAQDQTASEPKFPTMILKLKGAGLEVEGPIENKILCYGMLKMAEQAIEAWIPEGARRPAQAPGLLVPPRGRFETIS